MLKDSPHKDSPGFYLFINKKKFILNSISLFFFFFLLSPIKLIIIIIVYRYFIDFVNSFRYIIDNIVNG